MENVVLVIHLILALLLVGAVLLQRSEGGALGIGGGGGNVMSGRGAATALQKATWGLAAAFVATSLTLAVLASQNARDRGLIEGADPAAAPGLRTAPALPDFDGAPPSTDSAPTTDENALPTLE